MRLKCNFLSTLIVQNQRRRYCCDHHVRREFTDSESDREFEAQTVAQFSLLAFSHLHYDFSFDCCDANLDFIFNLERLKDCYCQ